MLMGTATMRDDGAPLCLPHRACAIDAAPMLNRYRTDAARCRPKTGCEGIVPCCLWVS